MAVTGQPAQALRFGDFEADLQAGQLRKHGLRIRLQEQPFQILAMMLDHPGGVVTREQLRQRLWPGNTFVDFEHGLNNAINRLREALNDSAEAPRFIETLPRRGYRFIAPVNELEPRHGAPMQAVQRSEAWEGAGAGPVPPVAPDGAGSTQQGHPQPVSVPRIESTIRVPHEMPKRRGLALLGTSLAALAAFVFSLNVRGWRERLLGRANPPPIESLAVLPLENLSGDPAQEYFSDGITDQLTIDLAQIGALRVISRTSAMQYKGTRKKLPQVARELQVDAVVEGTVVRSGDRVRINVQLIHAPTDGHIWANSYERDQKDIVALQNDVARAIANEIQIKLTPQEQLRLSRARTVNQEAYEEYLQGLYVFNKDVTTKTFANAAEHFQKAIEKDPGYASAHAGLATSYAVLGMIGALSPREMNSKAKSAAERALAIDETIAKAHSALGFVLYYDWDWSGAEREFKRAMQANPSDVLAYIGYSIYLTAIGRFDQAIAQANRAQELDPLSLMANWNVANVLVMAHQYDGALEKCRRVLEMDPNFERAHFDLARIYWHTGLYKEAVAEIQKLADFSRQRQSIQLAYIYAASGDKPKARKLLAQALQEKRNEGDLHELAFASVYVALGDIEEAFKWLEQAYEHHDYTLAHLKWDPAWDPIRSDPRFKDLVRRMAFPE